MAAPTCTTGTGSATALHHCRGLNYVLTQRAKAHQLPAGVVILADGDQPAVDPDPGIDLSALTGACRHRSHQTA